VANTFKNPEVIAAQALGLLQREIVLPKLFSKFTETDFEGAKDYTVNVRVPASVAARKRTIATDSSMSITTDELTEAVVPVVLTDHIYSSVPITNVDLTLGIKDFGEQVQLPQARGVAEEIENLYAVALRDADWSASDYSFDGTDDAWQVLVELRRQLNVLEVPQAGRSLIVGYNVEAFLLEHSAFYKANESGGTSALEDATLGRKAGFTIVSSGAIDPDFAYAVHTTAICGALAAPIVPDGASAGGSMAHDGLAMTWLRDYDADTLRDRSILHTFAGAKSVEETGDTKNFRGVPAIFGGS
jgi:hypothetical protein